MSVFCACIILFKKTVHDCKMYVFSFNTCSWSVANFNLGKYSQHIGGSLVAKILVNHLPFVFRPNFQVGKGQFG